MYKKYPNPASTSPSNIILKPKEAADTICSRRTNKEFSIRFKSVNWMRWFIVKDGPKNRQTFTNPYIRHTGTYPDSITIIIDLS